jgi:hypothetical protein
VVIVADMISGEIESRVQTKGKIMSLHKMRMVEEDEEGYKHYLYKVVGICRNGIAYIFSPKDQNLNKDWVGEEIINNNLIFSSKDTVSSLFQN